MKTNLIRNPRCNAFSILLVLVAGVLTACTPTTPRLDTHFGESVETVRAQQTLNPQAALNTEPVPGIDGQAGDAAVDNYRNSFRHPGPPMRGVIDLGNGGGRSSGGGQ